jgi:hypothetical protein
MEFKTTELAKGQEQPKGFAGRAPLLDLQRASARIIMVFCDTHFESASKLVRDMGEHNPFPNGLEPVQFSKMLEFTPETRADLLLIGTLYPDTILANMGNLESVLNDFRRNNPRSPIIIANLYGKQNAHGAFLHDLEKRGIAKVVDAPVTYDRMVEIGVECFGKL